MIRYRQDGKWTTEEFPERPQIFRDISRKEINESLKRFYDEMLNLHREDAKPPKPKKPRKK
jgi:hypothetical protein